MSFFDYAVTPTRRRFIGRSALVLSGTAIALLAGREALASRGARGIDTKSVDDDDVRILNTALAAEYEAVAAYQLGADSGLLQPPVLALTKTFQGQHKEHIEVLAKTVAKLGGKPVEAKAKYTFPTERLKAQVDVLRFAATLEQGAVSAYLGAVPVFHDRAQAKTAASILGDEAMHWAILRQALGEMPVPAAFVS